jgi:hypothetical protein
MHHPQKAAIATAAASCRLSHRTVHRIASALGETVEDRRSDDYFNVKPSTGLGPLLEMFSKPDDVITAHLQAGEVKCSIRLHLRILCCAAPSTEESSGIRSHGFRIVRLPALRSSRDL